MSAASIPADPDERLEELGALLALGFLRLAARQNASLSRDFGDFPLDFADQASLHGVEGEAL